MGNWVSMHLNSLSMNNKHGIREFFGRGYRTKLLLSYTLCSVRYHYHMYIVHHTNVCLNKLGCFSYTHTNRYIDVWGLWWILNRKGFHRLWSKFIRNLLATSQKHTDISKLHDRKMCHSKWTQRNGTIHLYLCVFLKIIRHIESIWLTIAKHMTCVCAHLFTRSFEFVLFAVVFIVLMVFSELHNTIKTHIQTNEMDFQSWFNIFSHLMPENPCINSARTSSYTGSIFLCSQLEIN